jgi:hypothetical protein
MRHNEHDPCTKLLNGARNTIFICCENQAKPNTCSVDTAECPSFSE